MRISIVVPHLGDDTTFEESLVSVLEHRPRGADVYVVHDGSYRDPFDLGDEVRFLTAATADLPVLVAAAAESVTGRVMHVIGGGVRATHGWTDEPLSLLERQSVAIVAPLAYEAVGGRLLAAGWRDSWRNLTEPLGRGRRVLAAGQAGRIGGAYLAASFWRRTELRAATRAGLLCDRDAAEFAWARMLVSAGWQVAVSEQSRVHAEAEALLGDAGFRRGWRLQALAAELDQRSPLRGIGATLLGSLLTPTSVLRRGRLAQLVGQAASLAGRPGELGELQPEQVHGPDDVAQTLPLPKRPAAVVSRSSNRRAA